MLRGVECTPTTNLANGPRQRPHRRSYKHAAVYVGALPYNSLAEPKSNIRRYMADKPAQPNDSDSAPLQPNYSPIAVVNTLDLRRWLDGKDAAVL